MRGMRKRVTIGFLSIVCLLFFSGLVSFFELNQLGRDTGEILQANKRNIDLAKEMLDAAHEQNVAFIDRMVFGGIGYDSICLSNMSRLENTLLIAQNEAQDKSALDSLAFATTEMRLAIDGFFEQTVANSEKIAVNKVDTAGARWYSEQYEALYSRLTSAIKSYMTSTQSSIAPRAEQMKKNAYRAVMPVLISLTVMIAIVLMLFYFMLIYCVSPIEKMNKGLGDYLSFHVPFMVKNSGFRDEVLELKEKVETLISLLKQNKG